MWHNVSFKAEFSRLNLKFSFLPIVHAKVKEPRLS